MRIGKNKVSLTGLKLKYRVKKVYAKTGGLKALILRPRRKKDRLATYLEKIERRKWMWDKSLGVATYNTVTYSKSEKRFVLDDWGK